MKINTNFYTTRSNCRYLPSFSIVNEWYKGGYFYFGIYFLNKAYWFYFYKYNNFGNLTRQGKKVEEEFDAWAISEDSIEGR